MTCLKSVIIFSITTRLLAHYKLSALHIFCSYRASRMTSRSFSSQMSSSNNCPGTPQRVMLGRQVSRKLGRRRPTMIFVTSVKIIVMNIPNTNVPATIHIKLAFLKFKFFYLNISLVQLGALDDVDDVLNWAGPDQNFDLG